MILAGNKLSLGDSRTDIVICSHSREGKTLSYRRINTVHIPVQLIFICTMYCQTIMHILTQMQLFANMSFSLNDIICKRDIIRLN